MHIFVTLYVVIKSILFENLENIVNSITQCIKILHHESVPALQLLKWDIKRIYTSNTNAISLLNVLVYIDNAGNFVMCKALQAAAACC